MGYRWGIAGIVGMSREFLGGLRSRFVRVCFNRHSRTCAYIGERARIRKHMRQHMAIKILRMHCAAWRAMTCSVVRKLGDANEISQGSTDICVGSTRYLQEDVVGMSWGSLGNLVGDSGDLMGDVTDPPPLERGYVRELSDPIASMNARFQAARAAGLMSISSPSALPLESNFTKPQWRTQQHATMRYGPPKRIRNGDAQSPN